MQPYGFLWVSKDLRVLLSVRALPAKPGLRLAGPLAQLSRPLADNLIVHRRGLILIPLGLPPAVPLAFGTTGVGAGRSLSAVQRNPFQALSPRAVSQVRGSRTDSHCFANREEQAFPNVTLFLLAAHTYAL